MGSGVELFRLEGAVERDPAVDAWLERQPGELGGLVRGWFAAMRGCGDEVRERMHDGCATACVGDAAFGYVAVFPAHMNVGFFAGSELRDPAGMLRGTGKRMRHVKVRPGVAVDENALRELITQAFEQMKAAVEQG